MKLKDYLFYRMYCAYKKNNEYGRMTAIVFLTLLDFFLILPFIFILSSVTKPKGIDSSYIAFIPGIILFILNYRRYIKKGKINSLIKKYYNSKYNKLIKNWMLYSLLFIAFFWGYLGIVVITKVLMIILSVVKFFKESLS